MPWDHTRAAVQGGEGGLMRTVTGAVSWHVAAQTCVGPLWPDSELSVMESLQAVTCQLCHHTLSCAGALVRVRFAVGAWHHGLPGPRGGAQRDVQAPG
jgi:hypothetical protein